MSKKYHYRNFLITFLICLINVIYSFSIAKNIHKLNNTPPISHAYNIYANAGPNMFSEIVRNALPRIYVPNTRDNTVSVIDPATYQVINIFFTGKDPEHVVPSYDLKTIWVLNNFENSVTAINPNTAKPEKSKRVDNPYNLYFTPDGRFAIVVADFLKRLDFRDPHTMTLKKSVPVNCNGLNHMDFTADGRYAIATCDESSRLVKIDVVNRKVVGYLPLHLNHSKMQTMPQDIRLSPDGRVFYVADMKLNGVFLIDPITFRQIGFIRTGKGTHSIYPNRNGKLLYVVNRGCNRHTNCPRRGPGSITVINPMTQKILSHWIIPGGGSPDMGNVSGDGKELWLSGKYDNEVYVFDTETGRLTHRIPVGHFPHGLVVWPQPGRYSLGHTGIMR